MEAFTNSQRNYLLGYETFNLEGRFHILMYFFFSYTPTLQNVGRPKINAFAHLFLSSVGVSEKV